MRNVAQCEKRRLNVLAVVKLEYLKHLGACFAQLLGAACRAWPQDAALALLVVFVTAVHLLHHNRARTREGFGGGGARCRAWSWGGAGAAAIKMADAGARAQGRGAPRRAASTTASKRVKERRTSTKPVRRPWRVSALQLLHDYIKNEHNEELFCTWVYPAYNTRTISGVPCCALKEVVIQF